MHLLGCQLTTMALNINTVTIPHPPHPTPPDPSPQPPHSLPKKENQKKCVVTAEVVTQSGTFSQCIWAELHDEIGGTFCHLGMQ